MRIYEEDMKSGDDMNKGNEGNMSDMAKMSMEMLRAFMYVLSVGLVFSLLSCATSTEKYTSQDWSLYGEVTDELSSKRLGKDQGKRLALKEAEFEPASESLSPLKTRLVSLSVHGEPLARVVQAIAEAASLNVVMERGVDPNTAVTAVLTDVPVEDALKIIFNSVDYFYAVENNVLYVRAMETRVFEFGVPTVTSTYNTMMGGDVLGAAQTTGIAAGTTNTTSSTGNAASTGLRGIVSLQGKTKDEDYDVWKTIKETIEQLIGVKNPGARSTIVAAASASTPPPVPAQGVAPPAAESTPPPPPAALTVDVSSVSSQEVPKPSVTFNKISGAIMVTATKEGLGKVENYIATLKRTVFRQVLIEARIVEVQLSDSLQFGIDWNDIINTKLGSANKLGVSMNNFASVVDTTGPNVALTLSNRFNFSSVLRALQSQGKTKVLSNPRLNLMNGQPAILSVGRLQNYVSQTTLNTVATLNGVPVYQTAVNVSSVFSGSMIGIVTYIDDKEYISLTVTPVISDLVNLTKETYGTFTDNSGNKQDLFVTLPQVDLREMSTTVKVKNDDMIIIGGLISSKESLTDNQVPVAGNIPIIGNLFKSRNKSETRTELVIMIKPHIAE
ncbi:MAG: hypothetical protein HQK89_06040 [Nitrospirae bacterium]|nr:hypothetical protein [Nitrospirota bacterium]